MFPNSTPGEDSRLRKAIRSLGLKIGRISSPIRSMGNCQVVDVADPDSGSEYKDVPVVRPDASFVNFPYNQIEDSTDVLKNGISVLLGFLEGTRAPVVLGVVSQGLGGAFRQMRSNEARTGDKTKDNAAPQLYEGDTGVTNPETGSLLAIRGADGDVVVVVYDLDVAAYDSAKTPEERSAILAEAASRSPDFFVSLFGENGAFRLLRNPDLANDNSLNNRDTERVLNARYWGMYKNLVEYPYVASLAARVRNIEDILSLFENLMKALQKLSNATDPVGMVNALPELAEAVAAILEALLGGNKPSRVRNQLTYGLDIDAPTIVDKVASIQFTREQGGDTFLPLFYYQAAANFLGISTKPLTTSDSIDRPFGFGGSQQYGALDAPVAESVADILKQAMEDFVIGPGAPGAPGMKLGDLPEQQQQDVLSGLNSVFNQLEVPFEDTYPEAAGPILWESLMSSLVRLGLHYEGSAHDDGDHLGIVEE